MYCLTSYNIHDNVVELGNFIIVIAGFVYIISIMCFHIFYSR